MLLKIFAKLMDEEGMSMITDICSMHLLLLSATDFEIAETTAFLNARQNMKGLDIDFLCTGVGILSTAYALTRKIVEKSPELILQAGIGGCTDPAQIGKTFAVITDKIADLGVTEKNQFKSIFDLNLAGKDDFPYENGWLPNPAKNLIRLTGLEQVKGITINEITSDNQKLHDYKQIPGGTVVESMEGAALHYVCLKENIPFLQIRAVSNELGVRDKSKWKLKEAIQNLNKALIAFLEKINATHENDFRL
jgi:futalosine hydrolase